MVLSKSRPLVSETNWFLFILQWKNMVLEIMIMKDTSIYHISSLLVKSHRNKLLKLKEECIGLHIWKPAWFWILNSVTQKIFLKIYSLQMGGRGRAEALIVCFFANLVLKLCLHLWCSMNYDWKPLRPKGPCEKKQWLFPYLSISFLPRF